MNVSSFPSASNGVTYPPSTLSSITLQPSKLLSASLTFSIENDFSNCKLTDSECETEIGNLTQVAVKSIFHLKFFLFHWSFLILLLCNRHLKMHQYVE